MQSWCHYYFYRELHEQLTIVVHRLEQVASTDIPPEDFVYEDIDGSPRWDPASIDARESLLKKLTSIDIDNKFQKLDGIFTITAVL